MKMKNQKAKEIKEDSRFCQNDFQNKIQTLALR